MEDCAAQVIDSSCQIWPNVYTTLGIDDGQQYPTVIRSVSAVALSNPDPADLARFGQAIWMRTMITGSRGHSTERRLVPSECPKVAAPQVEMSVAMALGNNARAIALADAIERQFTADDGELLRPMRIAKARATKATAVAREGDLDEATAIGESVFEIERQGIPEIMRQTEELAELLANFKPAGTFIDARTDRGSAA